MSSDTIQKTPPIYNSVLSVETSRADITNTLYNKLIDFNSPLLNSNNNTIYTMANRSNLIISDSIKHTGLDDIDQSIPFLFSHWQPVMQIARSSRGDGTVSIPRGTATTITMYNNESADNFFTAADTGTDENNIPLCYWGYQLDNPSAGNSAVNAAPNTPPFRIYSNQANKPGVLLAAPGKTRKDTSILYYQFTFPYNCYVYMVVNAALNWNSIEGNDGNSSSNPTTDIDGGRPSVFMITDENENTVIARTSNDDGNGKNDPSKNRPYGVIHWHGYVKKGWKLYYVEQESYLSGPSHGKSGHCCIVFKSDNNETTNAISNNSPNVLSLYKYSTRTSTEDLSQSPADVSISIADNEKLSNFIVENESKLSNLITKTTIPNTPIFATYSKSGSKPGKLFPTPGTNKEGMWATLLMPYDCYVNFSLMAGNDEEFENVSTLALMVYDDKNNKIVAKTTYDDGNGGNTPNKNRYWGNIHYTGILKKGYKLYFALINFWNPTTRISTNGLKLDLFKLPEINTKVGGTYITSTNAFHANYETLITNIADNTTSSILNNVADNTKLCACIAYCINNTTAFDGSTRNLDSIAYYSKYAVKTAEYDGVGIISCYSGMVNAYERIHSFYIHVDSAHRVKNAKYFTAGNYSRNNASETIKIKVKKSDIIYVCIAADCDTRPAFERANLGFASIAIIPTCYYVENY